LSARGIIIIQRKKGNKMATIDSFHKRVLRLEVLTVLKWAFFIGLTLMAYNKYEESKKEKK
jgi:hypothetical protein